jgi:HAD superfamily hydrolase (TIGR01509 family)
MSVAAVVFDLDGVLIDSERAWEAARRSIVVERGRPYPPPGTDRDTIAREIMGMNAPEWAHYLRSQLGVDLPEDQIVKTVLERVSAAVRADPGVLPGAVEAVRALAAGWPLAIASSASRSLITLALDLSGLADAFGVIVSAEEVPRGKPSPDVYLRAAELLRVDPRRCVAVEDSSNGIRSGKNAGMRVICIPNHDFPPVPEALALANRVLGSISELTPALIDSLELTGACRDPA